MSFENPNEEQSAVESEKSPQEAFMDSFTSRIDELVEEGRMPSAFAESRKKAAFLIEDGLTDPESQGVEFAEIGLEAVEQFQEGVREVEELTGEHILSPFDDKEALDEDDKRFDMLEEKISESINKLKALTRNDSDVESQQS